MEEYKGITGSEALIRALLAEDVDTIFGYPGGAIMPVFDKLYDFQQELRHILVRHEQGAVHAAQGYARACGRTGVVIVTSGPGATNVITGVADAMIDSTPLVVISGQVPANLLGTDAFQETDVVGITLPITKWSYQVRRPEDIAWAVARAFYIAGTGRPGPVVLDFTKTAQVGKIDFKYEKCSFIRSYTPIPTISEEKLNEAAELINKAKKPFMVYGQGVTLSHAEAELKAFLDKTGIPAAATLLGLSALPSDYKHYKGMLGMHGNIGPNVKTNECDVLIAIGMRFDDRVTGDVNKYARQAKIIHIDIDAAEIGKIIPVDVGILGDAKEVLTRLLPKVEQKEYNDWEDEFDKCAIVERARVIEYEVNPEKGDINMGEVIRCVSIVSHSDAIVVTDVGQNQMMGARYSTFAQTRSMITSGGLGTMGFGLPAAIGAKIACPERAVCFFSGDGGVQMSIQEFGTIMQEHCGVKIIILNNNWLGNVRQWQQMFFEERYSQTRMTNPDFMKISEAYGFKHRRVTRREDLKSAVVEMLADNDSPFVLEVCVIEDGMVFPMIPPGKGVTEIMLNAKEWF
ncbi:MAG: biosynthetic-type acetolactate synthase large subunit [Bacteroidales bacterium]|nr:biosynthetic-type acetolactate synthase large subunit [Bacteroidales bacterium]